MPGKLQRIGHRVYTLERLFNVQCGLTTEDDWLPDRFFHNACDGRGPGSRL